MRRGGEGGGEGERVGGVVCNRRRWMVIEGVGGRSIERGATLKDEEVFP